ncbi:MAG TPA: Rieske (2Fe-2S) protein [Solirubrobacteraceae bacterium]|nr:Rieske (2Fe-2S) protein [Solirubrobacteraceae bacterium]
MERHSSPLRPLVERIESTTILDAPGKAIGAKVRGLFGPGALKDALSGTWLGHALHPMLTDVVIGSWSSASLLAVLGGDRDGAAARRLIAVGLAAYGPTALSGVNDWADTEPADERVRRVGLVHATGNGLAAGLYTASLAARRRGDHGRGKLLALAGGAVMGAGGYLGGHMSFVRGVGPSQTTFDEGPADWTVAGTATDLPAGEPTRVVIDETPVLLLRQDTTIYALHDRCSHRGCSLSAQGEVSGDIVTCQCHGSQFALRDGALRRGPATTDQPAYEVRRSGEQIEVRLPPRE